MVLFRQFSLDESGFLLSSEAVILGTLFVIGLVVGLAEVRNATVQELADFSQAIAWLSQDYQFTSVDSSNVAGDISTSGSQYDDSEDDQLVDTIPANGVLVDVASTLDDE